MSKFDSNDPARAERILAWASADPLLQRRFRQQLAQATGWDGARCERAIQEYLRFCVVAARLGGRAVPSASVDQVWHLHLTWTRDYWEDFCPNRMGFAFHHQPSRGQPGEREALRLGYAETLHAYQSLFGTPDAAWWPAWSTAATRARRGRWARMAAALGLLPAASALALPGPLDWRGPEFLSLYLALLAASLLFAIGWRLWHRQQRDPARSLLPGEPPVWQLAYLRGGARGVVDAAAASLHEDGYLQWDAASKQLVRRREDTPEDSLLRALLPQLSGPPARFGRAEQVTPVQQLREQLVRQGWWHSNESSRRIATLGAAPLWLLVGFGIAKIAIGVMRDAPVALLVLLVIGTLIAALAFHFSRPGATRAGRELLAAQKARHALDLRAPRPGKLALAVALGGTALLAGTALAGYHELRHPPSSGDGGGSDSSDSSSDGGGGSGCGGCGGGD